MKKILTLIAIAAGLLAASSCAKQGSGLVSDRLVQVSIKATIETSRAGLDGSKVCWEAGDRIAVWDGVAAHIFTADEVDGTSATFKGEVTEGATGFQAVYPASAFVNVEADTVTVTQPAEQTIASGRCIDTAALVMTAFTGNLAAGLTMKNAVSLVKFTVDAEGICSVVLDGNGTEKFAGLTAVYGAGETVVCKGSGRVTVKPATDSFTPGDYYAAIAPTSFEGGITVAFSQSAGKGFLTTAGKVDFPRNGGRNIGAMASGSKTVFIPNPIMTAAQLRAFGRYSRYYAAGESVKLGADISLSGENWIPVNLDADFDGQDHSITDITIDTEGQYAGFFASVTGSVGNVTFGSASDDSSIRTTNASGTTYVGPIALLNGGSAENVTSYMDINYEATSTGTPYVGGVVGSLSTTSGLSSCSNCGNITITPAVGVAINIGGVAASAGKECTLSGCTNAGTIDFAAPSFTASVNFGGILGYTNQKITLSGCTNTGTLKLTNDNGAATTGGQVSLGGILGYSNNSANKNVCVVDGCTNGGALVRTGASATNTYLGGIVGYANYSITIKDCINAAAGAISSTKKSGSYLCQGGMIGSLNEVGSTLTVTDCANYGELSASNSTGNYLCQGGIVGYLNSGCNISGSDNSGAITRASGCTGKYEYVGGIIGTIPQNVTATIKASGCTNHGTLTVTGKNSISGSDRDGGIVGSVASKATYTDCDNFGTLLNNSGSPALRIGGIVGSTSAAVSTYTDCDNHGEIKCTNAGTSADIGGLCGNNGQACSFTTCINYGKVTGATTVTENVGGIFGNNTKAAKLISCSSRADITTAAATNDKAGAMVGTSTVSCTVTTCSVGAVKVGSVTLDANNYGSYLKGAATTAETNLTVANVIFLGEESSQSGSTETIGDLSDVTLE